jgi:hypothetical protein
MKGKQSTHPFQFQLRRYKGSPTLPRPILNSIHTDFDRAHMDFSSARRDRSIR